jgi:hypothetical protein
MIFLAAELLQHRLNYCESVTLYQQQALPWYVPAPKVHVRVKEGFPG